MRKLRLNVDLKGIGRRLALVRGSLKQTEFARELGINLTTYRNYEEGRTIPLEFIMHLHRIRKVSFRWLLTGEGRMEAPPVKREISDLNDCPDCEHDQRMDEIRKKILELAEGFFKDQEANTIQLGQVGKYLLLGVKIG